MPRSTSSFTRRWGSILFWALLACASVPVVYAPPAGFPSAEDASRIASDLILGLTYISANRGAAWLPALPPGTLPDSPTGSGIISSSGTGVPWKWYLLTGKDELESTLLAWLPPIPGRRTMPTQLNGKSLFSGKLQHSGYSSHLLFLPVCAMLPPSERRFVWWDREALELKAVPERADGRCYPLPGTEDRFVLEKKYMSCSD